MKKILLSVGTAAALLASAPASAQFGGFNDIIDEAFGGGLRTRLNGLDDMIQRAFERREISRSEADSLYARYTELRRLADEYRIGGLTRSERFELERRVRILEQRSAQARYDRNDDYDDDRGRWDEDDGNYRKNGCPPGLRNKNPACMPPGQWKKRGGYNDGAYGSGRNYQPGYSDNDRYVYRRDASGRVVQIDRRTGRVVRVMQQR